MAACTMLTWGCRTEAGHSGRSRFQFTNHTGAAGWSGKTAKAGGEDGGAGMRVVHVDAVPSGRNRTADYPEAALRGGGGDYEVFLLVTVDENGDACDVGPNPSRILMPHRFSGEFVEAAVAAVRTWRFSPARAVYWTADSLGEQKYLRTEKERVTVEVRIAFSDGDAAR